MPSETSRLRTAENNYPMTNIFTLPQTDEINRVIREVFELDPVDMVIGTEVLYRSNGPEMYDQIRAEFEASLQGRIDETTIRKRTFFGPDFAVFLETAYPRSEVAGLSEHSTFYYPICTREEIASIERPTNAAHHLLKIRAEEIAESTRLNRVFLRRREKVGAAWSLTSHFDTHSFEEYLFSLPDALRAQCERVEAGFAFLLDPNAACIRSPHGDIIVVSETLGEYLFFMNLFLMTQGQSIPPEDTSAALYIAIRTMMSTESPDFDLDPRGDPPEPLNSHCRAMVREQLQFVIGHEYAHHTLGHMGARQQVTSAHEVFPGKLGSSEQVYSRSQQQEFEADRAALLDPDLSDGQLSIRLGAVSYFFFGLELWQTVRDFIAPPVRPSTHPPARDRLERLRDAVLGARTIDPERVGDDEMIRSNFDHLDRIKDSLRNRVLPLKIEAIERYGSTYLPSYRRKVLHDRIDY